MSDAPTDLTVPENLGPDVVDDDALAAMHASVQAAIDELADRATNDPDSITSDDGNRAAELAAAISAVQAEVDRRTAEQAGNVSSVLDALQPVRAAVTEPGPVDDPADEPDGDDVPADEPPVTEDVVDAAPELVSASARRGAVTVPAVVRAGTMNPPLSLRQIAANAPAPPAQARRTAQMLLTAAADIPGIVPGDELANLDALTDAVIARARHMGITTGKGSPMPVASIQRTFEHTLGEGSTLAEVDAAFRALVDPYTSRNGMEGLVAAGGWCAPSEIDYSFFDVTGPPSGMVDIPTVGIRRGGLRWPESLDLAQFFALSGAAASGVGTNATMPWLWTEADDILAATGSPSKACLRPECPDFNEERLWLLGLCVLAGNLTEDAYPELIRHFLSLVQVAHARIMNRRHIALMAAHASVVSVTPTNGAASSAITHFLGAVELTAVSERYRVGMPQNAVMELVLPAWARGLLRSDISKRNGWDDLSVADAWFMSQLDARNIRGQWVEDWQSATGWAAPAGTIGAATAPVAWPSTFNGLMYPPGHFFRGAGMNLNLGVVRDSVLNEANDHTAAWSEEASLIGARGNRALQIVFSDMFAEGTTGAQTVQAAASA